MKPTQKRSRGKPPLSDAEKTVFYKLRVPESLHAKAIRLGPERIRALIASAKE